MVVATRRSKSVTIQPKIVTTASSFLEELPAKPKENFSLREAVDQLRDPLKTALGKGYSYQDLALMLRDQGIEISASTLKNYVPSGKRQASKAKAAGVKSTPSSKKSTAAKTSETMSKIASAEDDMPSTNGAIAETPKPRGRRPSVKTAVAAATPKTRAPKAAKATTKAPATRGRKKAI
jgi:hypothetical protein